MITAPFAISKPTSKIGAATFGILAAMAVAAPDLSAQRRGSTPRVAAPGALTVVERALRHGAGTVYVRLFGHDDLEVAPPVARLVGRTGAAHSAADDQDIAILEYGFESHQ